MASHDERYLESLGYSGRTRLCNAEGCCSSIGFRDERRTMRKREGHLQPMRGGMGCESYTFLGALGAMRWVEENAMCE